uniref:Uncharacterized protein n=1 Tax=Rhizophora mucronata TaxID=61149 RepID=A0A2P2R2P9_RHIMU
MVDTRARMNMLRLIEDCYFVRDLESPGPVMGRFFVFGCRFRFRSAHDSYSVACEAFSERQKHQLRFSSSVPIGFEFEFL